jgi:hypothetical protein
MTTATTKDTVQEAQTSAPIIPTLGRVMRYTETYDDNKIFESAGLVTAVSSSGDMVTLLSTSNNGIPVVYEGVPVVQDYEKPASCLRYAQFTA